MVCGCDCRRGAASATVTTVSFLLKVVSCATVTIGRTVDRDCSRTAVKAVNKELVITRSCRLQSDFGTLR